MRATILHAPGDVGALVLYCRDATSRVPAAGEPGGAGVRERAPQPLRVRREAADLRNNAEQQAYSVDKLLKDNDEKLPADVKSEVQADVDALKQALEGEDDDAVKTAYDKLQQSQTKLGEALYAQSQTEGAEGASGAGATGAPGDEDIVDAEVVDDEDEKK